jgi:hypothetical protein
VCCVMGIYFEQRRRGLVCCVIGIYFEACRQVKGEHKPLHLP